MCGNGGSAAISNHFVYDNFKLLRTKTNLKPKVHSFSTYPVETEKANLLTINQLKKLFKCNVGYSCHESDLSISYAASMLGISSLERHITLDRSMYGSDQAASIEFRGMKELISVINKMQIFLGKERAGEILEAEKEVAKKLRAHIKKD